NDQQGGLQASVTQVAGAEHGPYGAAVQVQPFQGEHGEEHPALTARDPAGQPGAGGHVLGIEHQGAGGDVAVLADLVGIGVVLAVFAGPPFVAQPDHQVGNEL